jgi:8-oxo-dGTP pyrophosphatase MutT (NUDIX family)
LSSHDPHIELQPNGENKVYETPWIDFYYDDVIHANGKTGQYAWVKRHFTHGAMMTIPVTPSEKFLVIRHYRHPMKRYFWEFPAGLGEAGEFPLDTARRELIEETGITPTRLEVLGFDTPVSGFVGEASYVVLAEIPEISIEDISLQKSEGIVEAKLLTLGELFELFTNQEIGEGVTLSCLARYWMWREAKSGDLEEEA